jgi:hypothetical protein
MRRIRRWLDEYPLLVLFLLGCGAFWLGSIPRHEPAKVEFNDETFQRIHWLYAVLVGLNTGVLIAHFRRRIGKWGLALYFLLGVPQFGVVLFLAEGLLSASVTLLSLLELVYIFGSAVFILLSEILVQLKLGLYLTRKRNEWVKEIEYAYLLLGGTSIIAGMNKLPNVMQVKGLEIVAALVLTFAIVLRLIKTRAEIGKWNTLQFYGVVNLLEPDTAPTPLPSA